MHSVELPLWAVVQSTHSVLLAPPAPPVPPVPQFTHSVVDGPCVDVPRPQLTQCDLLFGSSLVEWCLSEKNCNLNCKIISRLAIAILNYCLFLITFIATSYRRSRRSRCCSYRRLRSGVGWRRVVHRCRVVHRFREAPAKWNGVLVVPHFREVLQCLSGVLVVHRCPVAHVKWSGALEAPRCRPGAAHCLPGRCVALSSPCLCFQKRLINN